MLSLSQSTYCMSGLCTLWFGIILYRYSCSLFTKYLRCCHYLMTADFTLHCANALWVTEWWKGEKESCFNRSNCSTNQKWLLKVSVRIYILPTDIKLPLKCLLFLQASMSITEQQSCCLSCPPSENWFLAVTKPAEQCEVHPAHASYNRKLY